MMSDPRFEPGDYRMLGITGRDTFVKGDTFDLLLAFVYSRATSGGARGGLSRLQANVDDLFTRFITKPQRQANCFATERKDTGVSVVKGPAKLGSNIYPNPATKQVNIQLSDPSAAFTCEILNELGQVIRTDRAVGKLEVDCSDMPQGIYFIRLIASDNSQTSSHKLVVLHDN